MKVLSFVLSFSRSFAAIHAEDKTNPDVSRHDFWNYPDKGSSGTSETSLGLAGMVTTYQLSTKDSVEEVVAWYGKRLGLKKDHGLLEAASAGFGKIENASKHWIVYHDASSKQTAALIIAKISPQHTHITIHYRPSFQSKVSHTISISGTASGTSVIVMYPHEE